MKYFKFDEEYEFNSDEVANRLNIYLVNRIDEIIENIVRSEDSKVDKGNQNYSFTSIPEVAMLSIEKMRRSLKYTNGPDMIGFKKVI